MRADRLLTIIILLERHRRLTASELATLLAVSERTIYRDIDSLSLAGVRYIHDRALTAAAFSMRLTGGLQLDHRFRIADIDAYEFGDAADRTRVR